MKKILLSGIALILLSSIQAVILDIDQVYQEMTNWCWAATSETVLRYYGHEFTQTQIAEFGTDGLNEWNWLYGESENPTRRGINLILYHFAELETTPYDRLLDFDETSQNLNALKPIFLRWGWNTGGGHFVVMKGLDGTTVHLMDPWYGPTINSYDWTVSGGGHTWTHSLEMIAPPSAIDDHLASPLPSKAYPNPFRQAVTIELTKTPSHPHKLKLFNLKGQLIRELHPQSKQDNATVYTWDGMSNDGKPTAAGIYLGRIEGETGSRVLKLLKSSN